MSEIERQMLPNMIEGIMDLSNADLIYLNGFIAGMRAQKDMKGMEGDSNEQS